MPESDLEVTAMLSRATERVGLEWRKPPCPEPSRLDDWFLGVACAGSQRPAPGASLPDVHEGLTGRGRHLLLPETDLLTPPPSPPSVVQLGVTGVPPVERSVAMQVCPYTVSTRQGKPCLLFRACRYSSGLIRWGLCGLWRCCLHLMLRRYCRFFRLKALRDMHGGGYDPEVLKELRTAPDLAPQATKVMARSLGHAMSTLVVQERHLWLCLVDRDADKVGSSRFLYPRLASSATQPVTWPSSSRLHRSRLRRSNTSCLGGQLLPPPVRRLQRPACSSPRAGPLHPPPLPHRIRSSLQKRCHRARCRQAAPDPERERELLRERVSASLPPPEERLSLSLGPKRAWRVMDESTSDHTHPPSRQQAAVGGSRASSKATHAPSAKLWKQVNVHRTLRPLLGPPRARSLHSTSLPYCGYVGGPDGPACMVSGCRELPSHLAGS